MRPACWIIHYTGCATSTRYKRMRRIGMFQSILFDTYFTSLIKRESIYTDTLRQPITGIRRRMNYEWYLYPKNNAT